MMMVSAVNARGIDLRPGRNTDLVSLVKAQSRRNAELAREVTVRRAEVDALSTEQEAQSDLARGWPSAPAGGLTAVTGPAVTVTLDDAPASVVANGLDPDLLVVHQQDIQAVVNALVEWGSGGDDDPGTAGDLHHRREMRG